MQRPSLLGGFASDDEEPSSAERPLAAHNWWRGRRALGGAVAGAVLLAAAIFGGLRINAERVDAAAASDTAPATLVIETQPAGWHVWDGGDDRGVTPLTVTFPPGRRTLSLRRNGATRQLALDLAAGSRSVHHLELLSGETTIGDLRIDSIPPGVAVAVDGIGRGVTPVEVRDLDAGRHVVALLGHDRTVSRTVTVPSGAQASLVVALDEKGAATPTPKPAAPAVGWLVLKAAVDLEVFEGESLVGSSRNPRLLFLPGRHALRLVNRDLGVEQASVVEIAPGVSSTQAVALPAGRLSVNAVPWADVLLDDVKIGETPIADFEATVGAHVLTFRHPTLGEQQRTIVVSLTKPVRLGVDLRQ
jgi:hypothetical protein